MAKVRVLATLMLLCLLVNTALAQEIEVAPGGELNSYVCLENVF